MTVVPLRRLISSVDNGAWGTEPGENEVDALCIRAADFSFARRRVDLSRAPSRGFDARTLQRLSLAKGDIVLEKSGGGEKSPVGRAVIFDHDVTAVTSNFAARVRPAVGVDSRYLAFVLQHLYESGATERCIKQTTGIQNLDTNAWLDTPAPQPTLETQRRIADFLDDRVSRIDRTISARQKQIALLQDLSAEQLRLNVAGVFEDTSPMRSTSIGWSPRMHQEAEAVRLSRVVTLQRGVDLTEDQRQPGTAKVVTTAGVVGTHDEFISRGPGVVIGRYGSVGNVHWVEGPYWPHNTTLYVRSTHGNSLRWVYYLLLAFPYEVLQARAAVPGVNRNDMATEMVPLLPLNLQTVAVGHLDAAADDFDNRTRSVERSIELVTEYKTSLITAAVTGELDVTTAGFNIPG